jgi:hypothetical protein
MRLVHLSDLHLGYRQYQRLTPGGVNQREADVAKTFTAAIDKVVALAPDVVLVAGDVFHSVRPSNQAILHAFKQFDRLARALPDAVVVVVAGDHDTPRSTEVGGILPLLREVAPNVQVVDREPRALRFEQMGLSVFAVPGAPGPLPSLKPDAAARYNVLVLHGNLTGMVSSQIDAADPAAVQVSRADIDPSRWNYVALGHYHVFREIAANAFYSGSLDYTSVNTWGELDEARQARLPGKGFVEFDLDSGTHHFHHVPPARALHDVYPPVSARGLTVAELDERIRAAVDACPGGIDDKIVRLRVLDVARHIARELDHRALREYKRRAVNFQLDLRRPDIVPLNQGAAPGRRASLPEMVRAHLETRTIDADIDRQELIDRGVGYLEQAERALAPVAGASEN